MTNAPSNRAQSRSLRDLAMSNFSLGVERVVFLGPRGEVRDVFYPTRGDAASVLAKREELIASGASGAVGYLGVAIAEGIAQISLVETFRRGEQSVHLLMSNADASSWWSPAKPEAVERWISRFSRREEEPPE